MCTIDVSRSCRSTLVAFLELEGWLSGYAYYFVEQSGGLLGHFAFRYEQSTRLVHAVLTLVDVLKLDGWLSRYVG